MELRTPAITALRPWFLPSSCGMPARNEDLRGGFPDKSSVAFLLIDVINDLDLDDGRSWPSEPVPWHAIRPRA